MKISWMMVLVLSTVTVASAGVPASTPEVDAGTATAVTALLSGGLLILKTRMKK